MTYTSENLRLFHVSNLSVLNFRIFLLMYPGSMCRWNKHMVKRRHGGQTRIQTIGTDQSTERGSGMMRRCRSPWHLKPGPHRTRQRCSGPVCDRPSASRPVPSRQNRLQARLGRKQGWNSADGRGEDRASQTELQIEQHTCSMSPRGLISSSASHRTGTKRAYSPFRTSTTCVGSIPC